MNVILHLGLGSFHRAHQAVYLNRLIEQRDTRWSLAAGNIRDDMAATIDALVAQRGEYTLETVSPAGERRYERIRAITTIVPFEPSLAALIDIGARSSTRIVSFTVTEAGYSLDEHDRLDLNAVDVRADVEGGSRRTIYGAVAAILGARMRQGAGPVTLLNCDNLRRNGERFRAGLLDFLERRSDVALRGWVEANTSCPNAMVDRITPRPPADLPARVAQATGWADRAPVMAEPFIQWVIEDGFIAGRPAWENAGAEMVASVHAHEEAKIRLLNATHSCIAWAATLLGLTYIHEGVAVAEIAGMARAYVTDDAIPCLDRPESPSPIDLVAYRDVVLERFGNPHLLDTNQRVAMDGFSKIPGFIVPTLRECLGRGASIDSTAMLPALFFAVLGRWHRGELPFVYQDGAMNSAAAHGYFATPDPMVAFARDAALWGPLAGDHRLIAALRDATRRVGAFVQRQGAHV